MSDLIPIKIVNLALDAKDREIKEAKAALAAHEKAHAELNEKFQTALKNNSRLRDAVLLAIELNETSNYDGIEISSVWHKIKSALT